MIYHYLKRCAQSARPWIKAVKEVKEVKTNKTKKLKKTLVQIWHKMVPKWSQNDPKMAPSRSQDGPKMPQEGHKKQQKHENGKCWAQEVRRANSSWEVRGTWRAWVAWWLAHVFSSDELCNTQ